MSYIHLTQKEKFSIEFFLNNWFNQNQIALKLNRLPSTIKREVDNYSNPASWKYEALYAIEKRKLIKSEANQLNKTRLIHWRDDYLINHILSRIKINYYSPEQISWELKQEKWIIISKDTIYKFIYTYYPELVKKYFRRRGRKYIHDRRKKCQLPNRTMIEERPQVVDNRERIWDWEWDLIVWPRWSKKVLLTLVERKSWFLQARILNTRNPIEVLNNTIKIFKEINRSKKYTLTLDNGWEFREHEKISKKTKMNIYFCNPYHSWEKWTIENTNWLIRQFFPKWTDFSTISKQKLQYYVYLINYRPRKRLNYKTPYYLFFNQN
jgi:IS30 family transposase